MQTKYTKDTVQKNAILLLEADEKQCSVLMYSNCCDLAYCVTGSGYRQIFGFGTQIH